MSFNLLQIIERLGQKVWGTQVADFFSYIIYPWPFKIHSGSGCHSQWHRTKSASHRGRTLASRNRLSHVRFHHFARRNDAEFFWPWCEAVWMSFWDKRRVWFYKKLTANKCWELSRHFSNANRAAYTSLRRCLAIFLIIALVRLIVPSGQPLNRSA